MEMAGNLKNPFLFDDPAPVENVSDIGNPFLNGGNFEISADAYTGINPFSDVIDNSASQFTGGMNIFGDPSAYSSDLNPFGNITSVSSNIFDMQPPVSAAVPGSFDIFSSASMAAPISETNLFGDPEVQPHRPPPPRPPSPSAALSRSRPSSPAVGFPGVDNCAPGRPPPPRPPPSRPPPPSKETKDLLQTVIGEMEATTDTIQDKLPKTPSPSPASGIHAIRSPTPDIQITGPDKEPDSFSTIFGQTIELSDQEVEESQTTAPLTSTTTTDPEITSAHSNDQVSQPTSKAEEIDLFGEPVVAHSKTKTNKDIMSLFNQPQDYSKQKIDLLSDDLMSENEPSEKKNIYSEIEAADIEASAAAEKEGASSAEKADSQFGLISENEFESQISTVPNEEKSEDQSPEITGSPEQSSEISESELTVIEAGNKSKKDLVHDVAQDLEYPKAPIPETDETVPKDIFEEETTSPEVGTSDHTSNDGTDQFNVKEIEEGPIEAENNIFGVPKFNDQQNADTSSDAASNEHLNETVSESVPPIDLDNVFGGGCETETPPSDLFGDYSQESSSALPPPPAALFEEVPSDISVPLPSPPTPAALFGDVMEENFTPQPPPTPAALFGDIEEDNLEQKHPPTPAALFGDVDFTPQPPPSPAALFGDVAETKFVQNSPTSIFGDVIEDSFVPQPPPTPASLFGDIAEDNFVPQNQQTAASLFGDITEDSFVPQPQSYPSSLFGNPEDNFAPLPPPPPEASTGFDIFGVSDSTISSVPSGADSTGAALFETTAPAPNVGMSLFGGGAEASLDIFAESECNTMVNPFGPVSSAPQAVTTLSSAVTFSSPKVAVDEEFDAFSARFDNVTSTETADSSFDPFTSNRDALPWGEQPPAVESVDSFGFGDNAQFDAFLAMNEPPPVPQSTPRRTKRESSQDSDETPMNVVIKPNAFDPSSPFGSSSPVPVLAPPPAALSAAFTDSSPRFNPFDKSGLELSEAVTTGITAFPGDSGELQRSDSQETPPTPLFEEDQSVPLEPFPRTIHDDRVWEMYLRQPNKKKITGQRFWKKVYVKYTDAGALQLYNNVDDKEPFQELPLQPCYSVSDIGAQQFDQFGKIFTVKVQYIFYKERPGVRPGQISKAERITSKLSKFAQHAIAGDYEGVKEFASDVRKLGMPVEHAPQISQLMKLGTQAYEDLKVFASIFEEFMFKLTVNRDRALTYKTEEVQLTAVDEMFVEQDVKGVVLQMVARVRIFFLGFLTGMPEVDLGINDLKKQGCEVVGRHDIIPVITEEWIRLEDIEFHNTVDQEVFEKTRHIKFKPPDACYIELMRYRVRPPKNRELPLQVKTKITIQGKRVDIFCEVLVPGFSGRKLGQVPCEDVAIRFPLPESWIYMFRVEKHFRYGSVKSAHRRTGKVKGMERFKGAVDTPDAALMEVTSGQAKYEHQHRAVVWRMSRLPKEGQGAYTTHQFTCKLSLTDYDQIPQSLDRYCILEFTMPATTVSHCVMRSVSVTSDDPPEKYVRYLARHEYKIEIEFSSGSGPNEYIAATMTDTSSKESEKKEAAPTTVQEESSSDESS